jgi:uncharacterized protein (UPF0147 family)
MDKQIDDVIAVLLEVIGDQTVPRNVKAKLESSVQTLKNEGEEISMRVDKVIQDLDEIANDTNTQSYTRSQIWNILSLLESLDKQ